MRKKEGVLSLFLMVIVSFVLLGCDGNGSSRKDGHISGTALSTNILTQGKDKKDKSALTKFKSLFSVITPANAQGPSLSGIPVDLINSQGFLISSTTTSSQGRYNFNNVQARTGYTIQFNEDPALFTTIDVFSNSNVVLNVSLNIGNEILLINDYEINLTRGIALKDLQTFILNDLRITRFSIDGRTAQDCIKAENFTDVEIIIAGNIDLIGCRDGIHAKNRAVINLSTTGSMNINVDTNRNGIFADNDTIVTFAGPNIRITGGETGIIGNANTVVTLNYDNDCLIEGLKNVAIERKGLSDIITNGCAEVNGI